MAWNYFGLVDRPAEGTAELAEHLESVAPGRFVVSVGMWAQDDETLSPDDLRTALRGSLQGGTADTWVTPSELLDDEHWAAVREVWRPET